MAIYKLVLHNQPQDSEEWFDYEDAVEFEQTDFPSREQANEALIELCIESGTDIEENFEDDHPRAVLEDDYLELYGDESMIGLYW
ncbi:hypothetical protein [Vibrio crassostreae]|uniref:hypothetical protein n=1 Tax=Vibrio crassostreae TaxID=246167 RepID=UPI001B30088A|nr:hypothetical protein [Vibrio crassostreae]